MQDPFDDVKEEVQSSLQATANLLASYRRIRSTATHDSEELKLAREELLINVNALAIDLGDLEESVKVVEQTGPRIFGIEEDELMRRQKYVGQVRREIDRMKVELFPNGAVVANENGHGEHHEDDQTEWTKQEQQILMERQDQTLDSIQGTLTTLAQQAGLMGQEVEEHNEMLGDLERGVDRTDSKLQGSLKKLQKFIRDTEETKSGWCIGILIVILCILLLMVILI